MQSRKSRDPWSNRQVWPWSTKWCRAKANSFAKRRAGHSKQPLPTTQDDTWPSPDGQHRNQIDCILCSWVWKSSKQSAKIRPGADCGSDHELSIAKFRFKLKKVGKTTRPFRYDLNQIPYDYTVEVRNRLKGLDLIDRVTEELWTEVLDIVWEAVIKTIPMTKKCKKAKWLSEEALQIGMKRRKVKGKGEKERHTHLNAEFQRIARRDKKASFSDQCKEIEENHSMGKTETSSRKLETPRELSM